MTNKKHNYDWDAKRFDPDEDFYEAFSWIQTPQGEDWWSDNQSTPEGQAEFARMRRLYAEDMAAKKGPVRTVTTARKEIVPGVYGAVRIDDEGFVVVMPTRDADELTDAIKTLTQIRDALV